MTSELLSAFLFMYLTAQFATVIYFARELNAVQDQLIEVVSYLKFNHQQTHHHHGVEEDLDKYVL